MSGIDMEKMCDDIIAKIENNKKIDKAFEDGYKIGREARDREIAERNVFYSNRHIEDIVLETAKENEVEK